MKIKIQKLSPDAVIPTQAYEYDAGIDIHSNENISVESGTHAVLSTGICIEIPPGYAGLIWDKSGLAVKYGIKTKAGVIDAGYRGELKIAVMNLGKTKFIVKKGMKIAQLLVQKTEQFEIEEVTGLSDSVRGDRGFGSSGI